MSTCLDDGFGVDLSVAGLAITTCRVNRHAVDATTISHDRHGANPLHPGEHGDVSA